MCKYYKKEQSPGPQTCLPPDNPWALNMEENEEEMEDEAIEEEVEDEEIILLWEAVREGKLDFLLSVLRAVLWR